MSDETPIPPEISPPAKPKRRPRYSGRNPRKFHEKYKELNPDRYDADVQKVLASGKTPAGMHRPIMVSKILEVLLPAPGFTAVDCTLGYGGHAQEILQRIQPGGRLIGLDVDPHELPRTEARLRAAGFGPETFTARRSNFAGLPQVLAQLQADGADIILADLGVSSMQLDNPERGFTYKDSGPLDMRMNPARGESAAQYLQRAQEDMLARVFAEYSDEPYAREIAHAVKTNPMPITTTDQLATVARHAVSVGGAKSTEVEISVRRVFQALRIVVNDEFSALDTFLRNLPFCLRHGGRVAVLTFHSGEDRRVKKAFQAGEREGTYSAVARDVTRATQEEIRANPRAASAKLRWAVRAI